jgi:hypothetical protein
MLQGGEPQHVLGEKLYRIKAYDMWQFALQSTGTSGRTAAWLCALQNRQCASAAICSVHCMHNMQSAIDRCIMP